MNKTFNSNKNGILIHRYLQCKGVLKMIEEIDFTERLNKATSIFTIQNSQEVLDLNHSKENLQLAYKLIHEDYKNLLNNLCKTSETLRDYFSWARPILDIHIVYFKTSNHNSKKSRLQFFSKSKEFKGTIIVHDLTKKEIPFPVLNLVSNFEYKEFLKILIEDKFLNVKSENILDLGVFGVGGVERELGTKLFSNEYKHNVLPQTKKPTGIVKFNDLRIHKALYNFEDMLKTINNNQLTFELEDCIYAYEMQKFFLCACGLGSVIEHLLSLCIEKHMDRKNIRLGSNATAQDYIAHLRKEPFNINTREINHLKNIFAYRNSVSHFNKGYTNKMTCDNMLNGLRHIFENYYLMTTPISIHYN